MFKKLAIVLVALFAFGGTVSAYAWWDQLQVVETDQTLTIGVGAELTVSAAVHADATKVLVPDEALLGENDVKSYEITYTLELDKDLAVAANFTASVDNIEVNGVANPSSLISVVATPSAATIDNGAPVTVTVVVTMGNPADQAAYDSVAGLPITFDITFLAS